MNTKIKNNVLYYTLVEILTVLVIVAILAVVVIPAFQRMIKGQSVDIAAKNISSKLKAVRAHAINNRFYTALLFPQKDLPEEFLYRSYRACVVDSGKNFERWLPGEKWSFLPVGASVLQIDNSPAFDDTVSGYVEVDGVNCSDIGGLSSVDDVLAIIFTPSGKHCGQQQYLFIDEATYTGIGIPPYIRTNPDSVGEEVTVDSYTGRVSYGDK